jgi:hypothetical protein
MTVQERYIERNACDEIRKRWRGALCIKQTALGAPDRLIVLPGGVHVWLEFKTPQGKLRPAQSAYHHVLKSLGAFIYVVHDTKEAIAKCREAVRISEIRNSKDKR